MFDRSRMMWGISVVAFVLMAGCRPSTSEIKTQESVDRSGTEARPRQLEGTERADSKIHHALLIGCTEYSELDQRYWLEGPVNDVALMRRLLIDRFGFDPALDDMVTLAADQKGKEHQPTRENIRREFARLGDSVESGESVVILLGGHGSQQPDNDPENPKDSEPDGSDEIFLPSDVRQWDGTAGTVVNAIVDDEFRQWLAKIVDRGAFVWLIMDSCHSGSGVRGGDAEVSRQVPTEVLVPDEAFAHRDVSSNEKFADTYDESTRQNDGGLVVIYASQSNETTPERRLPTGSPKSEQKYYGLLTYTICEILSESRRNLTYGELAQAVQTRYIAMGRRAPTPLLEGSQRDNLILGREALPERSRLVLRQQRDKRWSVNAGALHRMSVGTVLAVYPPVHSATVDDDSATKPISHVRVTEQDLARSFVEPCDYDGISASDSLPKGGRCEVVFENVVDIRLRVSIDSEDSKEVTLEPARRSQLLVDLRARSSRLIDVVDDPKEADWLIRVDGPKTQAVPASGVSIDNTAGHLQALQPITLSESWADEVLADLERVARADHLLRIAALGQDRWSGDGTGLQMTLRDGKSNQPIEWGPGGLEARSGDKVEVELKNRGKQDLDVTLLYVDSAYGIDPLYPDLGESNRLAPDDRASIPLQVNAETIGIENLVAIAVRGKGQPVDFSILSQPSLELARTRGSGNGVFETPLGNLMKSAMFGGDGTRGVTRQEMNEYAMKVVTWRIMP